MHKDKIRILYGVECFNAGALRHVKHLCQNLDRHTFQIHLITSKYRNDIESTRAVNELRCDGVNIFFLPIKHNLSFVSDYKAMQSIRRYIKEHRIMIVHSHSSKAGFLFRLAACTTKARLIHTPHCYYFAANKGLRKAFFLFVERALSKITHRVVLARNENEVATDNNVISPDKIVIINNAVKESDYILYPREKARDFFSIDNNKMVIGGVGRLSKQKNWEVFIRAAAEIAEKHSNIIFLIAGGGEEHQSLLRLISELGLEKRFLLLGHIEDISMIYSCLDLFVSTSAWEGLPYTYLEASHFGIYMAVSKETVSDGIVEDNVIIYGRSNDHDKLAKVLLGFIARKDPTKEPYNSNRNAAGTRKFQIFIEDHETLYKYCLNS